MNGEGDDWFNFVSTANIVPLCLGGGVRASVHSVYMLHALNVNAKNAAKLFPQFPVGSPCIQQSVENRKCQQQILKPNKGLRGFCKYIWGHRGMNSLQLTQHMQTFCQCIAFILRYLRGHVKPACGATGSTTGISKGRGIKSDGPVDRMKLIYLFIFVCVEQFWR